ncbi:MAG: response regulator transcription factor [Lachnospiraceae bacterium]
MYRILLVEDDESIVNNLKDFLGKQGFEAESAPGQSEALNKLDNSFFDIALLDVSISNGNGFSLCRQIKAERNLPVIFLTASDDEYSVVTGLDIGADDYISKPFRPRELVSRIYSVLRRNNKETREISIGNLVIDPERGKCHKSGREVFLSALEYRLLLVFLANRGKILSRNILLQEIWDVAGEFVNDNTLTVYIKRLREKIEDDAANPEIIKTVRGLGYRMD